MTDATVERLLTERTTVTLTPGYEGANIGTIIGFKHVNYLIEKAVIEHFRAAGLPVGRLYEEYGLGFDIVELDSRLQTALIVDDRAEVEITPATGADDTEFGFKAAIYVERDGERKKAVTSKVKALLRRDSDDRRMPGRKPAPAGLGRFTVDRIGGGAAPGAQVVLAAGPALTSGGTTDRDPVLDQLVAGRNAYAWKFRVPYPYVHFFERMHMASYLRQMEEAKHRFVDARGISIAELLTSDNWIPAVTASRLRILDEALLEEDLYTVYTVDSIFKNLLYTSLLDCYVVREGRLVHVATGSITHAYGIVENGREGRLVEWDARVDRAFRGQPVQS